MPKPASHAFVPSVAHTSKRRTATAKVSRSKPPNKKHDLNRLQTMIRVSPANGFGAAEELEVFLHESKTQTRKPSNTNRGGAGTVKQKCSGHGVPRVAECYVMPNCSDVVVLHPGF